MDKKRKIEVPKSLYDLKLSEKKFAKKHNIRISEKSMSKRERKRARQRLDDEYGKFVIIKLNKALKILSDVKDEENKKIIKLKDIINNIILNKDTMKQVSKVYKDNSDAYPNLPYLAFMIVNTIEHLEQPTEGESNIDTEMLLKFCERILKEPMKKYKKQGMSQQTAFKMASIIPSGKRLKGNRIWYKRLIQGMYDIASYEQVNVPMIFRSVCDVDKKSIDKKVFNKEFFSEFILSRDGNRKAKMNDEQKELHETLIEMAVQYLDSRKNNELRDILKTYIRRRKTAESYKNDVKRVIKFVDFANSNSEYSNIKSCVQDLISDNGTNELYLS